MKIVEPGHIYDLDWLDGKPSNGFVTGEGEWPKQNFAERLIFVNREEGTQHAGTQTQEVLRALIDRTKHCDKCLRWEGNDLIIHHLRMALALHEARALIRKAEKGIYYPERITIGKDGHFEIFQKLKE